MADGFEPRFVDLVRNYTTTQGTGNFVLGSAVAGYRSFASAIQPGESFYYSALGIENPAEFEVGRGTMETDGSISRQPISGMLTSFTAGNKSVALVAAGEWYENVQAGAAAAAVAVSSIAELAALTDLSKPALLTERGRAGLFTFEAKNLTAEVAADTAQGVHVAPADDTSGASGAWTRHHSGSLEARWFGAVGDGVTDDSVALQSAIQFVEGAGGGVLRLGNATYVISGTLLVYGDDVTIDARGATLTSGDPGSTPMLWVGGNRARIVGGTWKCTVAPARQFDVDGRDCHIDTCEIRHEPLVDTTQMYVRFAANGFKMTNCHLGGATDAIVIESSNVLIMGNRFAGHEPGGGDDAIAIKAIQGIAEDIRIIGNSFENHAYYVSIGSQIGTLGANDPNYSRQVRNLVVTGNTGQACAGMLYIKPGAVGAYDYRDGTVEGIIFSDNVLYDLDGTKMSRPVTITPARGGRVRNVKGTNNLAVGRLRDDGSNVYVGLQLFNIDHSAVSPDCNAPSISDVDIQLNVVDPHGGVAPGGVAPGRPFNYGVAISNQSAGHGTMDRIVLDVSVNGTFFSGISVGGALDDAVTIRRASLANINYSGSGSYAGIQLSSRVQLGDEISIEMLSGNPYRLEPGTAAEINGAVDHLFFCEQLNPGTDQVRRPWAAPANAFVHKVELLSGSTISQSSDDANYTQFEFRNIGGSGNIFASASSKLTGGQSFPADTYNSMFRAREISSSIQQADCFFRRGSQLYMQKNDFGSGNVVSRAYLRVHWARY